MSVQLLHADGADFVEAVARRVVELLDEREERRQPSGGLADAQTVADALGVGRSTVYEHAVEFGAAQLGDGPRARLRLDLERARSAWTARISSGSSQPPSQPEDTGATRRRRNAAARSARSLLARPRAHGKRDAEV